MKKILRGGALYLFVVLTLVLTAVTGCNSNKAGSGQQSGAEEQGASSEKEIPTKLKIGASPVPHGEILKVVKEELEKENIALEIVEYTDYVQPNLALENGELDANFFQHGPYLEDFNKENDTSLVSVADVHFEPLGLYAGKTKSVPNLPDGGIIAVPSDTTNEARALLLLEATGIITLPKKIGLNATPRDIASNPKNLTFQEVEAALIPGILPDVDFGVINGNYALGAGLNAENATATEDVTSVAAQTFANILVVRDGDESRPEIQALVKAITSEPVADFINSEYGGLVIPIFK